MSMGDGGAQPQFMPLGEALAYTERCRTEGRLMEAEAICRQILDAQPSLSEAWHLLGIIAHQGGQLPEAIAHLKSAIDFEPGNALFHANLGEMLRQAGRGKQAVEAGRRAVSIDPSLALLGVTLALLCSK